MSEPWLLRRIPEQTLCWFYLCPNPPEVTLERRAGPNWPTYRVRVCERCAKQMGGRVVDHPP